ncbi:MAG: tyrosine-type recombinase/integrase [Victivallaceae bacterium]
MSSKRKNGNKKGFGYIRKRGKHFYWRRKINGKEVNVRIFADTLEEAEKEIERLIAISKSKSEIELAVFTAQAKNIIKEKSSLSIAEAFKVFENNPTRPDTLPETLARHLLAWNEFLEILKQNNPDARTLIDITDSDAERYAQSLADKSPRVYNSRVGSLKLIFRILERQSGLKENPFRYMRRKTEQAKSKKELTDEQLLQVFESIDKTYPLSIPHRDEMKILFRLGAYTGMRLKDCCLLKTESINFVNNTIAVVPSKTQKTSAKRVMIPIHPDLLELLKEVDKNQEYVLPEVADRYLRNPTGVDSSACRIIWYAIGTKPPKGKLPERLKGYGFHSLRHSFVSFCANAGVPLAVVQEIVGHNNVAVTHIYSHLSLDTLRTAVAAVPGKAKKENKSDEELGELIKLLKDNPDLITKTLETLKKNIS